MPHHICLSMADFNVLNTTPEVAESVSTAIWTVKIGENSFAWSQSKSNDLGIVTHVDIASIVTRFEHQSVSTVTPLPVIASTIAHFEPDFVNSALAVRVRRIEDQDSFSIPVGWIWLIRAVNSGYQSSNECCAHLNTFI